MDSVSRSGRAEGAGTRGAVLDAVLQELAECELADVLKCLTPAAIARGREFSPSTVRYHFARESGRFDREALAAALVDDVVAGLTAHARDAAHGYLQAIETLRHAEDADIDVVERALLSDLEPSMPGVGGPEATARGRLYLLAVGMCDNSGALTARLRNAREEILDHYAEVYEAVLAATGRRMVAGMSVKSLALTVHALLEGMVVFGRQHVGMDARLIASIVVRIVWAFTTAPDEPDVDVAAELVAAVR